MFHIAVMTFIVQKLLSSIHLLSWWCSALLSFWQRFTKRK